MVMKHLLGKYTPYGYALIRIIAGLLFACHGAQKLYGVLGGFGGQPGATAALFSLMGFAGIIEFFGGLCITFGFLTHYAAFIASGEMAVAYFRQHAPQGFWPIQNEGELAVLYCFLFLYIAAKGAGPWSVMGSRGSRRLTPMEKAERDASSINP
jgi:putative oxidoreductase